ncbi:hypothetical protein BAG01nite_10540 [Brevibacillus agri]|uniref:Uncharacterized protein n=1 Tax=Brevibacillus agri TaxID=51101 RepID=A0ABQ0SM21_9BACL|nr:hypothetical protein BAG01nite_10540 [Brevibacillus agri]
MSISYYYLLCRSYCKAVSPVKYEQGAEKRKKRAYSPFFVDGSINIAPKI